MKPTNLRAVAVEQLGLEAYNQLTTQQVATIGNRLGWYKPSAAITKLDAEGFEFHGAENSWSYSRDGKVQRGFDTLEAAIRAAWQRVYHARPPTLLLLAKAVTGSDGNFSYQVTVEATSTEAYKTATEANQSMHDWMNTHGVRYGQ